MITIHEAIKIVEKHEILKKKEVKSLKEAVGCILCEDIYSPINMPPFRQSAMDGYGLVLHNSNTYTIVNEVKAGDSHKVELKAGEAVRIFTGGAVPDSVNAIAIQENTINKNNVITLTNKVKENDNIRPLGEQVKKGELALAKKMYLTPASIGFLASLGITEVPVFKKPSITIIVTGNELVTSGNPLLYGKIYESNSVMLQSVLCKLGFTEVEVLKVKDNYNETLQTINVATEKSDIVLITGGISVGDYDFVGKALKQLNVEELFYKVKQKPGKPLFFGKKKHTTIFALPGNPAAVLTCFYVYVYPVLQKMSGNTNIHLKKSNKISNSSYCIKGNRDQFLKAFLKEDKVTILEGQSSAMLQTFSIANALVLIPESKKSITIGEEVEVIHIPL